MSHTQYIDLQFHTTRGSEAACASSPARCTQSGAGLLVAVPEHLADLSAIVDRVIAITPGYGQKHCDELYNWLHNGASLPAWIPAHYAGTFTEYRIVCKGNIPTELGDNPHYSDSRAYVDGHQAVLTQWIMIPKAYTWASPSYASMITTAVDEMLDLAWYRWNIAVTNYVAGRLAAIDQWCLIPNHHAWRSPEHSSMVVSMVSTLCDMEHDADMAYEAECRAEMDAVREECGCEC